MTSISMLLVACAACTGAASISGHVSPVDNGPAERVRVFAEPGLGGALLEAEVAPDGAFRFEGVPAGIVGVFAIADGYGWTGVSRTIAGADDVAGLHLNLERASTVSGKVVDQKGKPVSGARVTRMLLQGTEKVGIPFTKLAALGYPEPSTSESGAFTITGAPRSGSVAIKVAHAAYAQATGQDIAAGSTGIKITLYQGILVQGTVLTWDGSAAVADTAILFRSATPPHDTAIAVTDSTGDFHLRLMPGVYAYQASGTELRSPGWQRITLSGTETAQRVSVRVAASSMLRGTVQDAVTGSPIEGARLTLSSYGNPSAVAVTGPSGTYEFAGVQGENVVSLDAAPGYRRPSRPILNVQAKQGERLELPAFWMTRLPAFGVRVVNEAGEPVSGVVVRLLRPMQYRWYTTGADGRADLQIANSPPGDKLVGMVEHVEQPLGALFAIDMMTQSEATVQLVPWATVTGKVTDSKGKGVGGVVVGAIFQDDADSELLPLWRTVSRQDGTFTWSAVPAMITSVCVARTRENALVRSEPFTPAPSQTTELGQVILPSSPGGTKGASGKSLLGQKMPYKRDRAGDPPASQGVPALLVYCQPEEAALVIDGLESIVRTLGAGAIAAAVYVDGTYAGKPETVRVLNGKPPAAASTYVVNGDGVVMLETVGLPPASLIRDALPKG